MEKDSERATDESRSSLVMEDSVLQTIVQQDCLFTIKKIFVLTTHQFLIPE
jgi:hypothetical protein